MTKQCTKCGETKAFKFFYKHNTTKDGYGIICKQCAKVFSEKYYQRNLEKYRELSKQYNKKHFKKVKEYGLKWRRESLGVYLATFKEGTYVGEGVIKIRIECHKGGYSNVNKGDLTFVDYKVLEYIQDETKRKEREQYWIKKLNPSLNLQYNL